MILPRARLAARGGSQFPFLAEARNHRSQDHRRAYRHLVHREPPAAAAQR